jgi:hypothetical protein
MVDQSGSIRYQALFDSTLRAYEEKTGIALAEHPLAVQLQNCRSVEHITALLQEQMSASSDFRGSASVMELIKSTVSSLSTLSDTATLDWAINRVSQVRHTDGVFHMSDRFFCRHFHL